jgi:hypothetical protein
MIKIVLGFLFAGLLAYAAPVNVTEVSVGNGVSNGSYYVGPYMLSIDGGPGVASICVDPLHDSNPGDTWLANLTQLGSDNLSNTYQPAAGTQYEEAAYLFSLITQPGADQIGLQEAIWQIMAPTDPDSGIHTSATAAEFIGQAQNEAQNNFAGFDPSQYMIVSAVDSPLHQEFLTTNTVPEPTTFSLLGLACIGLGIPTLRKKNRVSL